MEIVQFLIIIQNRLMNNMKNCLFCEKYKTNEISVFGENSFFYYHLDQFPITPGHTEIIPKRHISDLKYLTKKEWNFLKDGIEKSIILIEEQLALEEFYKKILINPVNEKSKEMIERVLTLPYFGKKPNAYNHGINDGEAAGRTIHHLHWHIIPRYFGDVSDPIGGIRNIIPEVGNYRK